MKKILNIRIDLIHPRSFNAYPITDIEQLAESIERVGLLQPIILSEKDGEYFIVAGERRFTAFKQLYEKYKDNKMRQSLFETIPALLLENEDEERVYRDSNDYSRQLTNFQRVIRCEPDKIDFDDHYWKEQYVKYVYGEERVNAYRNGQIYVKGTRTDKCKLIHRMILAIEPDIDISEKTVRNYLGFYDRCNEDLKLATVIGKISIRDAQSLSWLTNREQTQAVSKIGTEEFEDYLIEGQQLAEIKRKRYPAPATHLYAYINKLNKLNNHYAKLIEGINEKELTEEEKEMLLEAKRIIKQ